MELSGDEIAIVITNQGLVVAGIVDSYDELTFGIRLNNAIMFMLPTDRLLGFVEKATHLGVDAKDFRRAYCGVVKMPNEAIQCVLRPMTEPAINEWVKIFK